MTKKEDNHDKKIVTELGTILDMGDEQFNVFMSSNNLGYLMGFQNFLLLTYDNVRSMKDEIVDKIARKELPNNSENTRILAGLYNQLSRIEHKVFVVREEINNRNKRAKESFDTTKSL